MSHSPQQRPWHLSWRPEAEAEERQSDPVAGLRELARDRVLDAHSLVRACSSEILGWLFQRPENWGWQAAWPELGRLLSPVAAAHGWRGVTAHWLGTLERLCVLGPTRDGRPAEVLAEEVGLWLDGMDEVCPGYEAWDGQPGTGGRRLPDPARCARGPLSQLGPGEIVAVHGDSEAVALALLEAVRQGLRPTAFVSEGGPELAGRRMATRLAEGGVRVQYHYDNGLLARIGHVDRIWIGTEAVGAEAFVGLLGTQSLLNEARRLEVPTTLLTTTDSLVPGGELRLPAWGEQNPWLLWESPPDGVELVSQPMEAVPLSLVGQVADENGMGRVADLALRALRTDDELNSAVSGAGSTYTAGSQSPRGPEHGTTHRSLLSSATRLFQA